MAEEKEKKKKSRKERLAEQREFDRSLGLNKGGGVNYDKVVDRHLDDDRYERELSHKESERGAGKVHPHERSHLCRLFGGSTAAGRRNHSRSQEAILARVSGMSAAHTLTSAAFLRCRSAPRAGRRLRLNPRPRSTPL